MSDDDKETDDKYIWLAIHALDFLREETDVEQDLKEFTHIVIKIISTMENWEDVQTNEECCSLILLAFEEWEKCDFGIDNGKCSIMLRGHYRSMMGELRCWIRNMSENAYTD